MSASSWGCELKCHASRCLLLSNVVSLFVRLWVEMLTVMQTANEYVVSLFVRLWVEIHSSRTWIIAILSASSWGCELKYSVQPFLCRKWLSASSWGCELKYSGNGLNFIGESQPLREAVSWNSSGQCSHGSQNVSLFVRLWVEILTDIKYRGWNRVSLFVRLWVEMLLQSEQLHL